jgi:hypothetical protein
MIRVPSEIVEATNSRRSDRTKFTPFMKNGITRGYFYSIAMGPGCPSWNPKNRSGPVDVTWTFSTDNVILEKTINMEVPDYPIQKLVEKIMTFDLAWYHRNPTNKVTECVVKCSDIIVARRYFWKVPDTLLPTLSEELEMDDTKIIPSQKEIPPDSRWKKGAGGCMEDSTELLARIREKLIFECNRAGFLLYKNTTEDDRDEEMECPSCGGHPCVWDENKEQLMHDNVIVVGECATNDKFRFFAYKQMTYIIHGYLGKGQRRQLPECVMNGIRCAWPSEGGAYTGFKDVDSDSNDEA